MKKTKLPGDNFSLKTKKNEEPLVMQWINAQTNLMDSLRYLIENEIVGNGIRNLQAVIPAERNILQAAHSLQQEGISSKEPPHEPERAPEEEYDEEDIESWI
jgi:HEPN domain-containing protein